MNPTLRRKLEQIVRQNVDADTLPKNAQATHLNPQIFHTLTPFQKEILDHSSKRKALIIGRRGGKSWLLSISLIEAAHTHPQSTALFLSTSREHAKRLIWKQLKTLNERFSLGMEFNNAELVATLPNKSNIWITGCPTRSDAEKFRGDKYSIVAIDESGAFPSYLEYLLKEVLGPAAADLRAPILLAGTPNATCTGPFYDICVNRTDYQIFHGDVRKNPRFDQWNEDPNWEEKAKAYLIQEEQSEDWKNDPTGFRREWLGEWVRDETTLIFPFDASINTYYTLPDSVMTHIIGVDFGTNDATAIVVLGYPENEKKIYVIDAFSKSDMSYQETCNEILTRSNTYDAFKILGDPSPGKIFIKDLSELYGLPIESADKTNKLFTLTHLSQEFKAGRIVVHESLVDLIDELKSLQWNEKHTDVKDGSIDHCTHGLLYAFREARHHWADDSIAEPMTQVEKYQFEADEYIKKVDERIAQEKFNDELNFGEEYYPWEM